MVEIRNFYEFRGYFWVFLDTFYSLYVRIKNEKERRVGIRDLYVIQVNKYFWLLFTHPMCV